MLRRRVVPTADRSVGFEGGTAVEGAIAGRLQEAVGVVVGAGVPVVVPAEGGGIVGVSAVCTPSAAVAVSSAPVAVSAAALAA